MVEVGDYLVKQRIPLRVFRIDIEPSINESVEELEVVVLTCNVHIVYFGDSGRLHPSVEEIINRPLALVNHTVLE